ncbi:MAG: branched-chain amino acid ABC transporter permease [Acetobacteraceae bacterium]
MSDTKTVRSANTREAIGIRKAIYLPILWAALVAMPFWIVPLGGYTALASQVLVIGLAAMGVNFIVGHTGVISFGHSAYFGLGAYGVGMTMRYLVPSTPIGLLAGVLVGTVGGAIVGYLIIRLRGIYFALATIAFSQVFYFIAFRWNSATGGDNGLTGFRRMNIHLGFAQIPVRSDLAYYYVVLAVFAVCTGVMAIILRSPFGRTLLAIRENERRARFLGIPINLHIWLAFTISCFFTAVAGGLYALLNNFTNPSNLSWELAGDFVLMAVIGGMRSFWGPLLGAAIFVVAQDYLSGITQDWMFFIGMIFVLAVLFLPRGVMGLFRK